MSTDHPRARETAIAEDGLRIRSRITRRRRKVKCDRRDPCSNCVKNQVECHFPVTGRLPRRRDPTAWKSIEALVTELAAQVEDGPDKIQSLFPGPLTSVTGVIHSAEAINAEVGKRGLPNLESPMAAGELISAMKSSFQGEINEDFGRLIVGKKPASSSNSQVASNSIYSNFYLENQYTRGIPQSLDVLYHLPSQMFFIWRTYVKNIVPFINVIDIAALEEVVTNLRDKFESLELSRQALLFAVSLAAITSFDEEETLACFDTPRIQLLARFRLGTERALVNAGLLTTRDVETIQAFVIYLSLLPYIGGQGLLSPFMGLLLTIATSLQPHRDAENPKPPAPTQVEIEIRRRLWWQIIFLDARSRSKHTAGLSASDTMFDTKLQSIICIMRCEIWRLCRFLNANAPNPLEQKLEAFNETRSRLENLSMPRTMVYLALSRVENTIYLQHFHILKELSQMPSQEMMEHRLGLSINILKEAHSLRTEPSWKRWRWQLQGDFPWTSMSVVVIQLCQSPWSAISEKGWALTHLIWKKPKTGKLINAAEAHRESNSAEATLQMRLQNKPEASKASEIQAANTHIPIDYPEFNQAALDFGRNIDEFNKFESSMRFNPMEWQAWDEGFIADDELWDFDFATFEISL
ncbi:hypothetical protein V8C34DRAFT_319075 [Trichoderma compactum]